MHRVPVSSRVPRSAILALAAGGLLLGVDLAFFSSPGYRAPQPDFYVYYLAAQIGWAHGWPAIYDPATFQPAVTPAIGRYLPYLNPPILAWVVTPLCRLPYTLAAGIWTALLVGSLVLTWLLTVRGRLFVRAAHLVSAAALLPVFVGFAMGQVSLMVVGLLAAAWLLTVRQSPLPAGAVLALAVALKPQIAFLLPAALLVSGYWRVVGAWLLVSLPIGALMLLTTGPGVLAHVTKSLALVRGTLGPVQVSVPRQLTEPLAAAAVVGVLCLLLIAALGARRQGPAIPFAVGLVASALLAPYINFYDLSALVLGAWVVLRTDPPRWHRVVLLALYVGLYVVPIWPLFTLACECGWLVSLAVLAILNTRRTGRQTALDTAQAAAA